MTLEKTTRIEARRFYCKLNYQNFSYNVDYHFSPYKPLKIQTVLTQHHCKSKITFSVVM